MQVRYKNRPTHVNFFVTDSVPEPATDGARYKEMFRRVVAGRWRLPTSKWVYLLCTAFTMLECNPRYGQSEFYELHVPDSHVVNGRIEEIMSSTLCLVRWCHRICPAALFPPAEDIIARRAAELIDPLAITAGCERLAWARTGEGGDPVDISRLNSVLREKIHLYRARAAKGNSSLEQTPRQGQAVFTARSAMRRCLHGRFRADDAFTGKALVDVQATSVVATPVAVLPDFDSCRKLGPWSPAPRGESSSKAYKELVAFKASQGYLLSQYNLRLNLFINPRSDGTRD